jgi:hypothetical protein
MKAIDEQIRSRLYLCTFEQQVSTTRRQARRQSDFRCAAICVYDDAGNDCLKSPLLLLLATSGRQQKGFAPQTEIVIPLPVGCSRPEPFPHLRQNLVVRASAIHIDLRSVVCSFEIAGHPPSLNGRATAGTDLTFAVNVALIAACDLS